jgi:hypothetical protein
VGRPFNARNPDVVPADIVGPDGSVKTGGFDRTKDRIRSGGYVVDDKDATFLSYSLISELPYKAKKRVFVFLKQHNGIITPADLPGLGLKEYSDDAASILEMMYDISRKGFTTYHMEKEYRDRQWAEGMKALSYLGEAHIRGAGEEWMPGKEELEAEDNKPFDFGG